MNSSIEIWYFFGVCLVYKLISESWTAVVWHVSKTEIKIGSSESMLYLVEDDQKRIM